MYTNDDRQDEPEYIEEPTEEEVQAVEEDIFAWKEEDEDDPNKRAKRIWKRLNPDDTLKRQEQMLSHGEIDVLPWMQYIDQPDEKLEKFAQSTFGDTFPTHSTDGFAYNADYIQHLITKLGSGEYDPELLNDAERSQIELQLKSQDL